MFSNFSGLRIWIQVWMIHLVPVKFSVCSGLVFLCLAGCQKPADTSSPAGSAAQSSANSSSTEQSGSATEPGAASESVEVTKPIPSENSPLSQGISAQNPFREAAEAAGLTFRHQNGMIGKRYILEIMAPGGALFDYDNDGDLDVFLVQGKSLAPESAASDSPPVSSPEFRHRLYRNDLSSATVGSDPASSQGGLRFTDVTEAAGIAFSDYGMGAIAADYDGDGNIDLYVTCYGQDRLLHNNGDQTFSDVTEAAGLNAPPAWNTSATWVDYDRDGRLDLFVCQYLEWTFDKHVPCQSPWGGLGYCGPKSFAPSRSRLYHNEGSGRFRDVSESSGVSSLAGSALGVIGTDLNEDGWPDLFVANDAMPNHLWINQQDGTFKDEAFIRGCAVNAEGQSEGNMGLIAADFHHSGRMDIFITHLKSEHATFYQNLGGGQFADVTASLGLDAATRPFTGFGTGAVDYDNNGLLDIFITNGGVQIDVNQEKEGIPVPLRQRCLLFRNNGQENPDFAPITGCAAIDAEDVGRGASFGDLDNDGDTDIVVNNNHGPVKLFLNDVGQKKHWLGIRLLQAGESGRPVDASGAIAVLERPGQRAMARRCAVDGSYLSSSDPRLLFGLGDSESTGTLRIRWPDGREEVHENLAADRYHVLQQKGTETSPGGTQDPAPAGTPQ
ncbi:MAG: CRTAC1 family protein [Planctomyces sp.]